MAITAYLHVDVNAAAGGNGSSWALAGANAALNEAGFEAYIEGGGLAAGNVIFIKEGTYVLDSSYNSSAIPGTAVSPIAFIGVKAGTTNVGAAVVYADWATGANRPFFDCVTWQFRVGNYYHLANLSFQGSIVNTVYVGSYNVIKNCKFDNDNGASAARPSLFIFDTNTRVINCEFLSANASGVSSESGSYFSNCYFHDMPDATNGIAITVGNAGLRVVNCIFDNIGNTAIAGSTRSGCLIYKNTFYGCATAISGTTGAGWAVCNNLFDTCASDAIKWTTQTDNNHFWGNHGNDARCTDMWDGVDTTTPFQDYEVTAGDPLFTVPGTDHSLQGSSPCLRTAEDIMLGVGATVINGNKGAWQGFPEAARNTIIEAKVENLYGYLHLGAAATGSLPGASPTKSRVATPLDYGKAHR